MSDYPEHEKLKKIQERSQACGEFLEWLQDEKNLVLCHRPDFETEEDEEDQEGEYFPAPISKMRLLAEFFDIDLDKLEDEKQAILGRSSRSSAG
jgi:hypothetical protein